MGWSGFAKEVLINFANKQGRMTSHALLDHVVSIEKQIVDIHPDRTQTPPSTLPNYLGATHFSGTYCLFVLSILFSLLQVIFGHISTSYLVKL